MSEGNAHVLYRAGELFDAGDWDGLGETIAQDGVMHALEGWPEPGPFRGRAAIVDEFKRLRGSFGVTRINIEETIERENWVVVRYRWEVEGAGSGVALDAGFSAAMRFEQGRLAESHFHWQHRDALRDAGVEG